MSLSIRKAEIRDLDILAVLMTELSRHTMSHDQMADRLQFIEKSPFDSLCVCAEDGRVLGVLGFRLRENLEEASPNRYGEISIMVVNKGARRKGVGRFLMKYAEKLALENGCKGTWLVSGFDREEEAHIFYRQLGYKINGYRFVKLFK